VNSAEQEWALRIKVRQWAGKVFYAAQMLAGIEAGWNQSLDRLAGLVAKS